MMPFSAYISGKLSGNLKLCLASGKQYNMRNDFQAKAKLFAKIAFSIAFFALGIVFVYSGDATKQTLGAGFLGTVIGYWIK